MFNRPGAAIGLAISHDLTIVSLNWRKKIIGKTYAALTENVLQQGEILDIKQFSQLLPNTEKLKYLALAIDDDWLQQQSFPLHTSNKQAIHYLVKQKRAPGNLYDYHITNNQCTIWQLTNSIFKSYQKLAKSLNLTIQLIEPLSYAQSRIFKKTFSKPYAIYLQSENSKMNIIKNGKVIFSHPVINHNIDHAIGLYEKLHNEKISELISNQACKCKLRLTIENISLDPRYLAAYSTAKRI